MELRFADRKLEKECNDARLLRRKHGDRRATLLQRRLSALAAAQSLATFAPPMSGPERCHELHANRIGQLSMDLDHPYRLIFRPDHDPIPKRQDGGLDWNLVVAILILGIEDTHE